MREGGKGEKKCREEEGNGEEWTWTPDSRNSNIEERGVSRNKAGNWEKDVTPTFTSSSRDAGTSKNHHEVGNLNSKTGCGRSRHCYSLNVHLLFSHTESKEMLPWCSPEHGALQNTAGPWNEPLASAQSHTELTECWMEPPGSSPKPVWKPLHFSDLFFLYLVHECFACVSGAHGGQRGCQIPRTASQRVVSYHVGAEN